jgi:hypothetical protein
MNPPLKTYLPILVTVGFSAVGVLGDYLLKLASAQKHPFDPAGSVSESLSMPRLRSAG